MTRQSLFIAPDAPYCGLPPAPEQLATAWNGDWRVLLALAVVGAGVVLAQRRKLFAMGWLALVVAFVSPLCALTVALFAARSVHHLWLLTVAAPLLGAALPQLARAMASGRALLATVLALALWHVPVVYGLAWQSHGFYWLMQLALLLPATVFWSRVFATLAPQSPPQAAQQALHAEALVAALAQMAALAGVMGLIGAVLTFAPQVLYPEHGMAPLAYGLHPLQDQQLAGLLMWAPGLLPLAVIAALVLRQAWQRATHHAQVATP